MSAPETASPQAAASRLGMVISERYVIRELLGEGGMGAVYLAEHTHMKKRVALKLLHPEMIENAEVSARFEREALAAAHIDHPNVAAATDFGKTEDGAYFLVLEYVEGTSLRTAVSEGPLSPQRALRITRQIALGLERAHDAGIVHRDLKPENVMLVKKDEEPDFVKVLDFGIAKLLEGAASASEEIAKRSGGMSQPLTRMGTILGTPEYMAPEQALGEPVTPAADLYGVGVMLYEMLTGRHPFDPPDRMAMLSFHIVAPVPLMQDRAPELDVPPMAEAIARRLLEKDSRKRYANARALVEAIEEAGAASGIDLGVSVPNPAGSQPGAGRMASLVGASPPAAPVSVRDVTREPGWVGNEAYAQTSLGLPAANAVTSSSPALEASPPSQRAPQAAPFDPARWLKEVGARPPWLYAFAGGVPLVLIFLIVMVVLAVRPKRPLGADTGDQRGKPGALEGARPQAAPADRVAMAVALGPEGLEPLAKEFPADTSLLQKLAIAYQVQGKNAEALRTVKALLAADASAAKDDEVVRVVTLIASKGQGTDDDEAFALLEGPLGERGVDALVELSTRAPGRESRGARDHRARAARSLAKPEVRAHASQATAVLLELKTAQTCAAKHDLLERAKEHGDARVLAVLKPLKTTRGCGNIFSRGDCYPCLRKDSALDDAVAAVEARAGAK